MKNSTKFKIIQFVTKLLNYYPPINLPTKEETRKIQEVQWQGILYEWDVKHELHAIIPQAIARELAKLNVIDFMTEQVGHETYKVTARAFFIEPLRKFNEENH